MTVAIDSVNVVPVHHNRAGDKPKLGVELRELFQYRFLLLSLVHRDLTVRYKRSVLGFLWTMLHPLLLMSIMVIVFASLFRFAIPHYETYFLSEFLPWNFFAQTTIGGMSSIAWNGALMKRVRVPKSIFPLSITLAGLVNLVLAVIMLFVIMRVVGSPIRASIFFLPISFTILTVFTLGVVLCLSSISVFFADVREVYAGVVTTAWMYITPIIYPIWIVPEKYRWIIKFNPMYYLLEIVRIPIYNGQLPSLKLLAFALAMAFGSLAIGWITYRRMSSRFYPHL